MLHCSLFKSTVCVASQSFVVTRCGETNYEFRLIRNARVCECRNVFTPFSRNFFADPFVMFKTANRDGLSMRWDVALLMFCMAYHYFNPKLLNSSGLFTFFWSRNISKELLQFSRDFYGNVDVKTLHQLK